MMKTPEEIKELLKPFADGYDGSMELEAIRPVLGKINLQELQAFLAHISDLCAHEGVGAKHVYADAALLAFVGDEETVIKFLSLTRYYE